MRGAFAGQGRPVAAAGRVAAAAARPLAPLPAPRRAPAPDSRRARRDARPSAAAAPPGAAEAPAAPADAAAAAADASFAPRSTPFWRSRWFPVAYEWDVPAGALYPFTLLGEDIVVWRDPSGAPRALKDACPHRLVPLSEGRINSESGNLECAYQ
jgi:hypothetical protein